MASHPASEVHSCQSVVYPLADISMRQCYFQAPDVTYFVGKKLSLPVLLLVASVAGMLRYPGLL